MDWFNNYIILYSSLPEEERLVRWRRMMIFLLCTTSACFTMAISVNISNLAHCFQRRRTKNEKLMTDGQLQGGKT
jgi:hypothetical protein